MKKIILATLAAASLVACAKEEIVVAPKGEAIAFDNAFVDNTTKAIDPSVTTKTLKKFVVYGTTKGDEQNAPVINIFNGVLVEGSVTEVDVNGDATAQNWAYAPNYTQYWIDGNFYAFAAVANGTVTPDANGMPKTISYNSENQKDLLYAKNTSYAPYLKVSSNKTVAFTFNHLLSKVKFTFKNESPVGGYNYVVTDLKIAGVGKNATCDVVNFPTSYTWAITDTTTAEFGHIVAATAEEVTAAINVVPGSSGVSNYERLVVPQDYTALTVSCRIATMINGKEADVETYIKPVSVNLEGGNAYNFVLSRKLDDKIQFSVVKVNEWVENPAQYTENNN